MNNYFHEIENLIESKAIKTNIRKYQENNDLVETYWHIGKLLYETQHGASRAKYGDETIMKWSIYFVKKYGKGYSFRNLFNMKKFYQCFKILQTLSAILTWSHICEILPIENNNKRNYYINQVILNNLSVRELRNQIKSNAFERLSK